MYFSLITANTTRILLLTQLLKNVYPYLLLVASFLVFILLVIKWKPAGYLLIYKGLGWLFIKIKAHREKVNCFIIFGQFKQPNTDIWMKNLWISQVTLVVKNLPANAEDIRDVGSIPGLGRSAWREYMANHSNILAWRGPWTQEPGGPQSKGSQSQTWLKRLGTSTHTCHL